MGGVLAVTVPPYESVIMGGHVSLWNAGLLLYRLVLAGVNCRDAQIKTYDWDISVIVSVKEIIDVRDKLVYDMGDLRTIREYLPSGLKFFPSEHDDPYYGNIDKLNWD